MRSVGRRRTLAPPAWGSATVGSRFSCLESLSAHSSREEMLAPEESSELLSHGAEDADVRHPRKSREQLVQEFRTDVGFPMPASRFWERRTADPAGSSSSSAGSSPSHGVVRLRVAMMDPKNLQQRVDKQGRYCLAVTVAVDFKVYDFLFRQEQPDFVPDVAFVPYFWRRKGNDPGNDGAGQSKDSDTNPGAANQDASPSNNMDVDPSLPPSSASSSHGKGVAASPGENHAAIYAVTPFNLYPKTPKAIEIVNRARVVSPGLIAVPRLPIVSVVESSLLVQPRPPVAAVLDVVAREAAPTTLTTPGLQPAVADAVEPRCSEAASPSPAAIRREDTAAGTSHDVAGPALAGRAAEAPRVAGSTSTLTPPPCAGPSLPREAVEQAASTATSSASPGLRTGMEASRSTAVHATSTFVAPVPPPFVAASTSTELSREGAEGLSQGEMRGKRNA
ncbi:hypothetical protein ACQ4PT_061553 [Festuca glaucescens]